MHLNCKIKPLLILNSKEKILAINKKNKNTYLTPLDIGILFVAIPRMKSFI